jgi:hypothetical protein
LTAEQEERFGKAMAVYAMEENKRARKQWGAPVNVFSMPRGPEFAKKHGALGGRVRDVNKAKMTGRATMVNKLLKKGMTVVEISEIMGATDLYVREAIRRFGLPRRDNS